MLLKVQGLVWVREVENRVPHITSFHLIPRAIVEVVVAPHRLGEILQHGQQGSLCQVGGDVDDQECCDLALFWWLVCLGLGAQLTCGVGSRIPPG